MEEKHYIEWIELGVGDRVLRQYLKPGQAPVAVFEGVTAADVVAREYCNLHGVWKA
jgi:superoxide reductase